MEARCEWIGGAESGSRIGGKSENGKQEGRGR